MKKLKNELLAPLCDFYSISSIIKAGADAVYFGLHEFNMRANAKNISLKKLPELVSICHDSGVKCYLAINVICYDDELNKVEHIIETARKSKIDAIIAWDMAVIELAHKYKIPIHLSTQASVANKEALKFYSKHAERIILARELDLKQIHSIIKTSPVPIECFVHGAMCVSVSGRCFLSQILYKKSANRGECLQPCRREYFAVDSVNANKLLVDKNTIFSPKDLCALPFMDLLIDAGIFSFKIEGRARSPEYIVTVTDCYRKAINAVYSGNFGDMLIKSCIDKLGSVYNKGFSPGFFLGLPSNNDWSDESNSSATTRKVFCGTITNFYKKKMAAELHVQNTGLNVDNKIIVQGNKTQFFMQNVLSIQKDHQNILHAPKGDIVGIALDQEARRNDKIYVCKPVKISKIENYGLEIKKRIELYKNNLV